MHLNTIFHHWYVSKHSVYQQLAIDFLNPLNSVGSVMQSVGIAYHFEPNLHTIVSS